MIVTRELVGRLERVEATVAALAALAAADFTPAWARAVFARPTATTVVGGRDGDPAGPTATTVTGDDLDTFLATLVAGMRGGGAPVTAVDRRRAEREFADPAVGQWLALVDGEPAGAALAVVVDGVAYLGPATTVRAHRRRGVQRALIEARLVTLAGEADLAMVTTHPDSASSRNVERCGFRLVQHQWVLRGGRGTS